MKSIKKEIRVGDIFTIPLFLPSFQEWRKLEDLIDYKKYEFRQDDMYAFGRLIDIDMGTCNLIEVFRYIGKIPVSREVIELSGRLFEPAYVVGVFSRNRWRFLFDNPYYNKWTDSDYKNISFLLHSQLWKGGEEIHITQQQRRQLLMSGTPETVIHGGANLEQRIRLILKEQGIELNYEQTVDERKNEYPTQRDIDKKLKEAISPFHWLSESGMYSLSLEADALNKESFEKNGVLGNGYDWENVAFAFIENYMPESKLKFTFDCEANTFSMQSSSKKVLKDFALAFQQFCNNTALFEELLSQL